MYFFHPLPPHIPKKCQMVIHTFHYHRHENARDCELKSSYRDHETIVNESSSLFGPPHSIVCAMLNSIHWIVKTIFQKRSEKVQVLLLLHLHLTMMMNNWKRGDDGSPWNVRKLLARFPSEFNYSFEFERRNRAREMKSDFSTFFIRLPSSFSPLWFSSSYHFSRASTE